MMTAHEKIEVCNKYMLCKCPSEEDFCEIELKFLPKLKKYVVAIPSLSTGLIEEIAAESGNYELMFLGDDEEEAVAKWLKGFNAANMIDFTLPSFEEMALWLEVAGCK